MKLIKQLIFSLIPIILLLIIIEIFLKFGTIKIESIKIKDTLNIDNTKTMIIEIYNPFNKEYKCVISSNKNINDDAEWKKLKNNKCEFNVNAGKHYLHLKDNRGSITTTELEKVEINAILDLELNKQKVFLTLGETFIIESKLSTLGNVDETLTYSSSDENIVIIENNIITPVNNGNAVVTVETTNNIKKEINVIVTDLYKKASLDNNKTKLTCKRYNSEEAQLLDEILEYKINEAGYQTRGAVVTSARFLVLEFPYKIDYFFENGRLNNYDNKAYVDGEGRFYHKGLYLHEDKFNTLVSIKYGPAIWGCPLTNWQNEYGYISGNKYPNGLDCSGFVSWALYNAGFDVGDLGAGDTYRDDDIGDLGIKHELTKEFVLSGNYKVGDLIGRDGHIAIIAGIDEENIHIAESLVGGVVIKTFPKNGPSLYNLYSFINTMDEIYKNEGKYTNMW